MKHSEFGEADLKDENKNTNKLTPVCMITGVQLFEQSVQKYFLISHDMEYSL